QDSKTPLMIGCIAIGMKAFLDWLLVAYYHFGVGGVTFSTTLITLMNMILLGILSKKHIQDLGFSALWGPFLKLFLAGAAMMGVMWALDGWVCPYLMPIVQHYCASLIQDPGRHLSDEMLANCIEVLKIIGNTLLGALLYLELALMLKVEEVHYLMARLFPRLKRFHHTPSP
ncbi:MAG: polysaccharide biosynthesis C-terminal domain-containing protein, partial [Cyanobacteria bacterium]|nr:polysaccharide biosynthesis C-terminal domain-containing protein [Cyanobacteriota bacterium]